MSANLACHPHRLRTARSRGGRAQARRRGGLLRPARRGQRARRRRCCADKGVEPGDRVGIMLPNVPYFAIVYYGVLRAGGVVVPMNVLLKGREVEFYLDDPEAQGGLRLARLRRGGRDAAPTTRAPSASLVKPGEFEKLLGRRRPGRGRRRARRRRHRGDPLHVGHDRDAEGRRADALEPAAQRRGGERAVRTTPNEDVILGALPLFHSFGQTCSLNCAISAGATLTLLPRFEPAKALEIIERDKVTVFLGVPTMYSAMLNCDDREKYDTSLSADLRARAARRCPSRSCAASRRRSTARCSRATACRRPRRSRRSTTPTRSASPARSARRSRASR